MSAPVAPAVAQIPTVGLSVELPADVARWDLVVLLADVLDLHAGEVALDEDQDLAGDDADVVTLSVPDLTRMLIVSRAPDAVRLRLLVTAPDAQAREVLAGVVDELAGWAADTGVDGWRWTADGCAGWHCGGASCLTSPPPVRLVGRWRLLVADAFALGMAAAYAVILTIAIYVAARWTGEPIPSADADWGRRLSYVAGDPAVGVPVGLAAYAAGRLLLLAADLLDPPADGRLAAVRAAVGPIALAVAGALVGWGWLA